MHCPLADLHNNQGVKCASNTPYIYIHIAAYIHEATAVKSLGNELKFIYFNPSIPFGTVVGSLAGDGSSTHMKYHKSFTAAFADTRLNHILVYIYISVCKRRAAI